MDGFEAILKQELLTDPLVRGYSGMTDSQALTSLNTVNISVDVETVEGWQLWGATDVTEWGALSAANRSFWQTLLTQQQIRVKDQSVRDNVLALFGAGTATRTALIALQTRLISRREQLELPPLGLHHIAAARA